LNRTINEQHSLIPFLAETFQKLKFKLLHHSLYSVDLTVCDSHVFFGLLKNYYMVADFQDVRERVFFLDGTEKLVDQCIGSPCLMLCPTALFYFNIDKW
jgi:hypothetical protein